jgi:putative DNA primase/helicase
MTVDDAILQACATVGIRPPYVAKPGKWTQTDIIDGGSHGRGDGRVIVDGLRASAWNWHTGQVSTVWLNGTTADGAEIARVNEQISREKQIAAKRAADIANRLLAAAKQATHPYLKQKGFADERPMTVKAEAVEKIGGKYLVPDRGKLAILIPARVGQRMLSAQLIWECGTKKLLAGGRVGGTSHRIARGTDTWLCEGLATGLSLRAALKSLNRSDSILCCFSASNLYLVSRSIPGRIFVAADNDKPMTQLGGLGTGEHYARRAAKPFFMPPRVGDDINDMHQADGIFAVQKLITEFLRASA